MTVASRYLSAGEIGLLALLETILGPIWVWLGIGERPTPLALVGRRDRARRAAGERGGGPTAARTRRAATIA